jgi:hypothetical protein
VDQSLSSWLLILLRAGYSVVSTRGIPTYSTLQHGLLSWPPGCNMLHTLHD